MQVTVCIKVKKDEYNITRYEGVSVWSDGTEWIVIQAKAH